jgi:hypothetical protein
MMDSGRMISGMARANAPKVMDLCMMDSGRMVRGMARANATTVMDLYMMDSGRTGTGAERESLLTLMEIYMKQCGQEPIHQNKELFTGTGDCGEVLSHDKRIYFIKNTVHCDIFKKSRKSL